MELVYSHKYQEPHYYGHITQEIPKVIHIIPDAMLISSDSIHNFNSSFLRLSQIGGNGKSRRWQLLRGGVSY